MRPHLIFAFAASLALSTAVHAEAPVAPHGAKDLASTTPPNPLPPPATTDHVLSVGGRTLHFKATAGAVRLSDGKSGEPLADIGYVAYQLEGADARTRPISVAINGGPGAASAWLDLGALGPWRLPLNAHDLSPSAATTVIDNADTWLDFTDLVFIDPPGTGYSRMLSKNDDVEKHFYAVNGDIEMLGTVVRKWLATNDRLASPKFIVGESYGGFRAPKLAHRLESTEGIGIKGLVMISPVIDFTWFQNPSNPMIYAARLPSLVAAARDIKGPDPRSKLQAVEAYASSAYLVDLYRGLRDAAAIKRMSASIASFTGLDPKFIQRLGGRVDAPDLMRERTRDAGRTASPYDTTVTGFDPEPFDAASRPDDPILDALKTPLATAMADVTASRLNWPVNARYEILSMQVNSHWDWGGGRPRAESLSDLREIMALDPHLRVLVAHGVTDQVTPYFTSKMLIDQLPPFGDPDRIHLAVYGGGHMLYLEDASRAALREDARKLIE
uniref:S10 family peptidase n=1 Tax=Beijerinckia sp. L45 TaxID=1641855 RepID=UPI001FED805E